MTDPALFLHIMILSYAAIGLKAFQQINVTLGYRKAVLPTSMFLSAFELYAYGTTIINGLGWYVVAAGIGAGTGSLTAMTIQDYLKTRGFYASR